MLKNEIEQLRTKLEKYYKEKCLVCNYDCSNCDLGVLESHSSGYSCAIETVMRNVERGIRVYFCPTCKRRLDLDEIDGCMNTPNEIVYYCLQCKIPVIEVIT